MQDLMEESGSYVFLTHEAVGVAHSNGSRAGRNAERHADLPPVQERCERERHTHLAGSDERPAEVKGGGDVACICGEARLASPS